MGRVDFKQPYRNCCVVLATKHAKSIAIAPPFWEVLQATVLEHIIDTDQFGTFSGEIDRVGSVIECARKKCQQVFKLTADKADFVLSSEGSFGPHPFIPFLPVNHELLYFIDRKRGFELHLSHVSEITNYQSKLIHSLKELDELIKAAQFPSHSLILRPEGQVDQIIKGVNCLADLETAFTKCLKASSSGRVHVETDMRAHCNPTRMAVIKELAFKLANRLATLCPDCKCPGWGEVDEESGLECSVCQLETNLIKCKIFGCVRCSYKEKFPVMKKASPTFCQNCNP